MKGKDETKDCDGAEKVTISRDTSRQPVSEPVTMRLTLPQNDDLPFFYLLPCHFEVELPISRLTMMVYTKASTARGNKVKHLVKGMEEVYIRVFKWSNIEKIRCSIGEDFIRAGFFVNERGSFDWLPCLDAYLENHKKGGHAFHPTMAFFRKNNYRGPIHPDCIAPAKWVLPTEHFFIVGNSKESEDMVEEMEDGVMVEGMQDDATETDEEDIAEENKVDDSGEDEENLVDEELVEVVDTAPVPYVQVTQQEFFGSDESINIHEDGEAVSTVSATTMTEFEFVDLVDNNAWENLNVAQEEEMYPIGLPFLGEDLWNHIMEFVGEDLGDVHEV